MYINNILIEILKRYHNWIILNFSLLPTFLYSYILFSRQHIVTINK